MDTRQVAQPIPVDLPKPRARKIAHDLAREKLTELLYGECDGKRVAAFANAGNRPRIHCLDQVAALNALVGLHAATS